VIDILQWTTLGVCALLAVFRIPSALRGENRLMFGIFLLMTLAILLSMEAPYVAVDQLLGGTNIANLVLRFVIFGVILLIGLRVARGFGAGRALSWIAGKPGVTALALACAAVIVTFLLMDTQGSSAGLKAIAAKDARNAALVEVYGAFGRLYPCYIAVVLLPTMIRTVRSRLPVLIRLAAVFLSVGAVGLVLSLSSPIIPPGMGFIRFIVNYTAVLCYVLGLAAVWADKIRAQARRRNPLPSSESSFSP